MYKYFKSKNLIKSEFHIKRYISFIKKFKNYESVKYHTEHHHILPRSLFTEYKDLKENPWNGVHLPHKAHFIAHWMLAKALGEKMWHAFHMMSNRCQVNGVLYEKAKIEHANLVSKQHKGRKNTPETIKKMKESRHKIQSNGKTIAENSAIKIAANRIKNGTVNIQKGFKNNNAKTIHIFDKQHKLMFECKGNFQEVCKSNKLPLSALTRSYQKGNILISRNITKFDDKFDGWYARTIN